MEQMQRRVMKVIFLLVVCAVFIAAAAILAVAIISEPQQPTSTEIASVEQLIVVEGRSVILEIDPEKAVVMGDILSPTPELQQPQFIEAEIEVASIQATLEPTAKPTLAPTATPRPEPVIFVDYLVQPGDGLYSISIEQNSSIELLAVHGVDAGDLVAGNILSIPVANPAYCPGSRAYVVRDHDTIFGIALSFNTTTEALMSTNSFPTGYIIKVAEVICIPPQ
jgi:LysM repeat protein